jgi:hypothetical protein
MKVRFIGLLTCLLFFCWWAASDAAQIPPPTLTGEDLLAHNSGVGAVSTSGNCDPDGTSTFSFTASGPANGPYPGTFTESGTFVIGPQNLTSDPARGALLSFDATFAIDSPIGQVTGSKTLSNRGGQQLAFCTSDDNANTGNVPGDYTAEIVAEGCTYADHGIVPGMGITNSPPIPADPSTQEFGENFRSDLLAPQQQGSCDTTPPPASVTLSPADAVNNVGTTHTVTATVKDAGGNPVSGVTVLFRVQGSTNASGSCTTDANGQCSFNYQGPNLPGADLIGGCADSDGDGAAETGEPCGEATKAWLLPASTPGQTTGGGQILNTQATDKIAFGFNAKSTSTGVKGECTVVDPSTVTNMKIKCVDVTTLVQTATHATFFGNATVDGVATTYRIDVDDVAEPGKGKDTFKIQTSSGYTAGGTLQHGNIQVHM